MYQAVIFSSAALISAAVLLLFRKNERNRHNILKALTVIFCTVGFARFFLSDAITYTINGGWFQGVRYEVTDFKHLILRWGYYTNYAVLTTAVFTSNRFFKNMAGYFSLPFSILSAVFFHDYMAYFLDPAGKGFHLSPTFRYAFFAAELALAIMIPLILHVGDRHLFRVKEIKEWRNYLLGVPAVVLMMTPVYAVPGFLGTNNLVPKWFSPYHLIWIGATLAIALTIYYIFRFQSYETRSSVCLFLILVLFFHYNSLYLMGLTLKRLPFQLCNFAAYIFLISYIFKWKKLFHYSFIANIVGTLFAMLVPDFGVGYTGFWNIHFLLEHSLVLIVPAVCMGLGIFPRLTRKSIGYYFVGFSIYICFCYILGTVLNGYQDITGETVNYFYLFDFKMAFDYFPFLRFVEDYSFEFGRFIVYPLVFVIVYVGYSLLCLLFFLFMTWLYRYEDKVIELHESAVDLFQKIKGRKARLPENIKE